LNNNNNNNNITILLLAIAIILVVASTVVPLQYIKAQTAEEIQAQIQALLKLLEQKKAQEAAANHEVLYAANLPAPQYNPVQYDKSFKQCSADQTMPAINSTKYQEHWRLYLTDFKCGHIVKSFPNNTALREFTLIADDNMGFGHYVNVTKNQTDPVVFPAWTFNNSLPAPTMRMTQGDHVKITVINSNNSKFPHSFHMHSIHAGEMDGITGPAGTIQPGSNFTYEFIARPFGVYPYHCHMENTQYHIMRGLYGMMVIDPPTPRPAAKEMVMLMNGYSFNQIDLVHPDNSPPPMFTTPTAQSLREATDKQAKDLWKSDDNKRTLITANTPALQMNDDGVTATGNNTNSTEELQRNARIQQTLSPGPQADNQIYTVNGMAFAYTAGDSVHLLTNRNYRIYIANLLEFDPINSFHLHGNMFNYFPSGTSMTPAFLNDIITLSQGDRGIIEMRIPLAGDYMFHAHVNRFTNLGWMGFFHVTK
jgi:hypothetical protein